jgi:DNA recombination protein RmuC
MNKLKDGAKKGDTIIGRFENIRELEAKTKKSIPKQFLDEGGFMIYDL